MCYMAYYPPGVMPDYSHLAEGAKLNRDGYGFAVGTSVVCQMLNGPEAVTRPGRWARTGLSAGRGSTNSVP